MHLHVLSYRQLAYMCVRGVCFYLSASVSAQSESDDEYKK